jgi:cell filamentation protein
MASVLAAAAVQRDLTPEARIGHAGIAMLPNRAPSTGQRYRVTLNKVRDSWIAISPQPALKPPSGCGWW